MMKISKWQTISGLLIIFGVALIIVFILGKDMQNNFSKDFIVLFFIIFLACITLLSAIHYRLIKRIKKTIPALKTGMRVIASGNFDFFLEEGENDEIGSLPRAFNKMTGDLKTAAARRRSRESEEGERILNTLMDNIPEGIIIADAPGSTVRMISKFLSQITGIPRDEAPGRSTDTFDSLCKFMDNLSVLPVKKAISIGESTFQKECRLQTPSGEFMSISMDAVPIKSRNGRIIGAISSWQDITDLRKASDELRRNEYELRSLLGNSPDLIVRLDRTLRYVYANPAFERVTGFPKESLAGKTNSELGMSKVLGEIFDDALRDVIETGRERSIEFEMTGFFGRRYFWGKMIPEFDKTGYVGMVLLIARDITDRKNWEEQIRYISFHDQVTGLYNRTYFEEEMQRIDNVRDLPVGIIIGDVNNLKLTNDALGHSQGDALIKKVADILRICCRKEDIIARWGGDEFVVILPKTDFKAVSEICKRIIEECGKVKDMVLGPSMALGVGVKESHEKSIYRALREAEEDMYKDKSDSAQKNRERVIAALSAALFKKRPEIAEHIERMKHLVREIIPVFKLSPDDEEKLLLVSEIHELGKISIPENIWLKQGELSSNEMEEMRKQSEASFRIAQSFSEYAPVSGILLSLNEHWDGSGYPHGTKQYEIPYLSRIYVILDAFDVMTNARPYAPAVSAEKALRELEEGAGTMFDPELTDKFIRSMNKSLLPNIRILLADDHVLFRDGTVQLLMHEPGFDVIGQANDGNEAIDLARRLKPDVILMDIMMPHLSGIEAARVIHGESPDIPIIGLSMHDDDEYTAAMREAGAAGFMSKACEPSEIVKVIREYTINH